MTSDLVDLLKVKCCIGALILILVCIITAIICIHLTKVYDRIAQFYEECLNIISVLYGDKAI